MLAAMTLVFAPAVTRAATGAAITAAADDAGSVEATTQPAATAPANPDSADTSAAADPSAAATTQPHRIAAPGTPAGWVDAVARFADVACGKDLRALVAMLSNGPILRTFASDDLQLPERLLGTTTGSQVLAMHVYPRVPATLATDLAADFRNAPELPENVRARMIPTDGTAAKRANETAAAWLVQMLQPSKDQPVAVMVLWRHEKTDTYAAGTARPVFVLMKGSETATGQYVFRQVTFGDPLDAPK
jgi:hypothetical protein